MDEDLKAIIMGFCGLFTVGLVIFGCVAFFGSMETLEATECGLDFDTTRVKIDSTKLYKNGRHFIGLTHQFLVF
jgi:hypothetical protein